MHQLREDNTLYVTLSLRKYIPLFVSQGLLLTIILSATFVTPENGFLLLELGKRDLIFNRGLYLLLISPIVMIILGLAIERILYVRSYKIVFSKRNLEYMYGVLNKVVESVDMFTITDYVKKRGPLDQLLGIANITINSDDVRTPLIQFQGLLLPDARAVIEYLQEYATNTLVEFLSSKNKNGHGHEGGNEEIDTNDPHTLNKLQMLEEKEKKAKASRQSNQSPSKPSEP